MQVHRWYPESGKVMSSDGIGEMWVDTAPCPPCNKFGGIRSGVRAAGLDSLNIWFPGGP
jgi:hypothetical protein